MIPMRIWYWGNHCKTCNESTGVEEHVCVWEKLSLAEWNISWFYNNKRSADALRGQAERRAHNLLVSLYLVNSPTTKLNGIIRQMITTTCSFRDQVSYKLTQSLGVIERSNLFIVQNCNIFETSLCTKYVHRHPLYAILF